MGRLVTRPLKPRVTEVLVCDSRKNALLRVGNKSDREDARKLSELSFLNKLHPVYHGETGIPRLKELENRMPAPLSRS